jgi:hypothetical protein
MVNKAMSNTPMYPISMIVSYFIDYWRVGAASRCQLSWAHGLLLWDSDGQRKTNLLVCGVLVCPARLRRTNWTSRSCVVACSDRRPSSEVPISDRSFTTGPSWAWRRGRSRWVLTSRILDRSRSRWPGDLVQLLGSILAACFFFSYRSLTGDYVICSLCWLF